MNSKKKFVLFSIFLIISIFIAILSGYLGVNFSAIEQFFEINYFLSIFLYNGLFIILASLSFSVSVMTSFGVLIFPWYWVILYAMVGIIGSSIIDFYISRKLGKNYIKNYLERRGGKIEKFDKIFEKNAFKTTLILSAIFFVPPTIPNFLGGIMNINLKNYFVATFLGNIPNTFFTVLLVHGFIISNTFEIYFSTIMLFLTTIVAMFFYTGEIREIFVLSLPWIFKRN